MDEGEKDRSLRDRLRVLRHRWPIVALAIGSTAAATLAVSLLTTPTYEASAELLLQPRSTESLFDPDTGQRIDPNRLVQTEIQVLRSEPVRERVAVALGLDPDDVPSVSGRSVGQTDVVEVSVRNTDPQTARVVANVYANAYIDFRRTQAVDDLLKANEQIRTRINELQTQINSLPEGDPQRDRLSDQLAAFRQQFDELEVAGALRTGGAQLVRAAETPEDPVEPTTARNSRVGARPRRHARHRAALLVDHLDDTVKSREDLAEIIGELPVMAIIPETEHPAGTPVTQATTQQPATEAYRTLRTSLQFLSLDRPLRVLQVVSALPGEGKTTTVANLAVVLARNGQRVVAVDTDLRRPQMAEEFSVVTSVGLTQVLLGTATLDGALRPVSGEPDLHLLPSGPPPPNPSELLGSQPFRDLVNQLAIRFDVVVLDSAPVLPVSDALVLTAVADGVIFIVQANKTSARQVRRGLEQLAQAHAPVLGVVLNRGDVETSYAYDYRYRYGRPLPPPQLVNERGRRRERPTTWLTARR